LLKQSIIDQLTNKINELQTRLSKYKGINEKLKRERSELLFEQTRLIEQLTKAEMVVGKTVILGAHGVISTS
jgi:hypothetical protein